MDGPLAIFGILDRGEESRRGATSGPATKRPMALALLPACAKMLPGWSGPVLGSPLQRVKIVLTSRVVYEPFSPEFLANPVVQSVVAECQRKGEAHCGERLVPADSRTEFVRTQDKRIVSFVLPADRHPNLRF